MSRLRKVGLRCLGATSCSASKDCGFGTAYTDVSSGENTKRLRCPTRSARAAPPAQMKLNSWSLFWVMALVVSIATLLGLPHADFHSARGTAPIVHRSVRCALPLFVLAFTASSLAILWPSTLTRWMLANRRYIGLAFAFAMALHFGFVAYFIWLFGNPLNFRATLMDVIGFIFLLMMTLTSFRWRGANVPRLSWSTPRRVDAPGCRMEKTEAFQKATRILANPRR